jgi:hypothetical protein
MGQGLLSRESPARALASHHPNPNSPSVGEGCIVAVLVPLHENLNQPPWLVGPILLLVTARVEQNGESFLIKPVISNR